MQSGGEVTPHLVRVWSTRFDFSFRLVRRGEGCYAIESRETDLMGDPRWVYPYEAHRQIILGFFLQMGQEAARKELAGVPVTLVTAKPQVPGALILTAENRKVIIPVNGGPYFYTSTKDAYLGVQWVKEADVRTNPLAHEQMILLLAMFFGGVQEVEVELVSEDGVHHRLKSQLTQKDRSLV